MRLAGAQMSDRRSCLQRDVENKKTAKKIQICSHQVFFSLCLSECAMRHFSDRTLAFQCILVTYNNHSAPVDKWSLHTAAAGPHLDRTEAPSKVTFPQQCSCVGMYTNQDQSCFFCSVLIVLVPSSETSSCYFDAAVSKKLRLCC